MVRNTRYQKEKLNSNIERINSLKVYQESLFYQFTVDYKLSHNEVDIRISCYKLSKI